MAVNLTMKLVMTDKLRNALSSDKTIKEPMANGIKKATLYCEGEVKKRTPVDKNRLRPSITHEIKPEKALVSTNVLYAPHVEYGTKFMEARHVEPGSSTRVLGTGPFTESLEVLKAWLESKGLKDIAVDLEKRFK